MIRQAHVLGISMEVMVVVGHAGAGGGGGGEGGGEGGTIEYRLNAEMPPK